MTKGIFNNGVTVPNAGLVILSGYFKMLFERLSLIEENHFISEQQQQRAVQYLEFIVTGQIQKEGSFLVLNKVLCGIEPQTPTENTIEISKSEKELIEGMIKAAISYWSAIGKSSVDGFRGNWLVRNGIIREEEDRWILIVEKRSYDILMQKSPFSFSIIKMPWMEKPLSVEWNY